jgi:hypothetical protein
MKIPFFMWNVTVRPAANRFWAVQNSRAHSLECLNGIFQPFELGGETMLIPPAVINWRPGKFFFKFLIIQPHERSIKPFSAA